MKHFKSARSFGLARTLQRGTSLLEALAYLGIAATIIVGAIALLTNAFTAVKSNHAKEELAAIATGVKRLYMGQSTVPDNDLTPQLIAANIFPSTLTVGADAVTNGWGGGVTVTGGGGGFLVSYANVPRTVCIELASGSGQWESVKVNAAAALPSPVSPTQATTACANAANVVAWTMR